MYTWCGCINGVDVYNTWCGCIHGVYNTCTIDGVDVYITCIHGVAVLKYSTLRMSRHNVVIKQSDVA